VADDWNQQPTEVLEAMKDRVSKLLREGKIPASHRIQAELVLIRAVLAACHFPKVGRPLERPLTLREIQYVLGYSKAKISRRMKCLFAGGMQHYASLFGGEPPKGIRDAVDNGKTIDGVWEDRKPWDSDEGEEDGLVPC
jgi:hypothetical protein